MDCASSRICSSWNISRGCHGFRLINATGTTRYEVPPSESVWPESPTPTPETDAWLVETAEMGPLGAGASPGAEITVGVVERAVTCGIEGDTDRTGVLAAEAGLGAPSMFPVERPLPGTFGVKVGADTGTLAPEVSEAFGGSGTGMRFPKPRPSFRAIFGARSPPSIDMCASLQGRNVTVDVEPPQQPPLNSLTCVIGLIGSWNSYLRM